VGIKEERENRYFQEIAHSFLENRGAPFFLSSKDLALIETWERMGIPLQVVLEGIKRVFENHRSKPGPKGKILSLAFCRREVLNAFEQHKERRVGSQKRGNVREAKQKKAREAVQKFLEGIPSSVRYLEDVYIRALNLLSRKDLEEEEIERMEQEIEQLLFKHCSQQEKDRMKQELMKRYSLKSEEELQSVFRTKVVKAQRERFKVPYISFFYY